MFSTVSAKINYIGTSVVNANLDFDCKRNAGNSILGTDEAVGKTLSFPVVVDFKWKLPWEVEEVDIFLDYSR